MVSTEGLVEFLSGNISAGSVENASFSSSFGASGSLSSGSVFSGVRDELSSKRARTSAGVGSNSLYGSGLTASNRNVIRSVERFGKA